MKSGFQKRKDRDSRQRAAIAAKSLKMTEFFEEAACKNKFFFNFLGIPVEMVQFLLNLWLKQKFLAVHHDFR